MSLTAEQRRALATLTRAGLDGAPQTLLMAHGFCVSMIAGLVNCGLASLVREKVRVGSRLVDVGKVRITAAGRESLTAETLALYPAGIAFPSRQQVWRASAAGARATWRCGFMNGAPRKRRLSGLSTTVWTNQRGNAD